MEDEQHMISRLREETESARTEMEALKLDADRMSRSIETGLLRAVRTGQFGFEELGRIATSIMNQIARSAVHSGFEALLRGGQGGGLSGLFGSLLTSLGLPGRATGGQVVQGRGYVVGERGPELFVPTSSGQVIPNMSGDGGRDVRVSIMVNGNGQDAPRALARSARQVARAVRGALGD